MSVCGGARVYINYLKYSLMSTLMSGMMSISSRVILSKLSNLRASVKKVRGGARVYIKVAGSQSLKVCVGARVYIEGARVYIKKPKIGYSSGPGI